MPLVFHLGISQVSVYRTIGPTLVSLSKKGWFERQSTGFYFVFFCGCLREGESFSVVGTTDECYFFLDIWINIH